MALAVATLGACSDGAAENPATADTTTASLTARPSPISSPSPTPSPTPTPTVTYVTLSCSTVGGRSGVVRVPRETADFTQAWTAANGGRCVTLWLDGARVTVVPTTDLEKSAYTAWGHTGNDVATLYGICAAVQPDDVLLSANHVMSEGQVAEIRGALTLCPSHPLAAQYADAADKATNPDRQDEHPIYGGKYVVGADIPAGTYRTTGTSWDACYWARVNGDGSIIDNGFVTFAPDGITVTLNDGEGFESEGCGSWLKVG